MTEAEVHATDSEVEFLSYGMCISVKADDAALMTAIEERFPPGFERCQAGTPDRRYALGSHLSEDDANQTFVLRAEGVELKRSASLETVLKAFESDSRIFIGEMTTERVFLHAGAVEWRGRAIIIPGRSWSGKSTLVAALVKAGATYLSDEYAVLDRQGNVHPYLKPLALRDAEGRQTNHSVESIGGRVANISFPVGLILQCEYRAGEVWSPRRLTPSDGAMVLADNSLSIRRQPKLVLEVLRAVTERAETLAGHRGEAAATASMVLATLSSRPCRLCVEKVNE